MKISIGCDHGGFALKQTLRDHLQAQGHELVDVGCYSQDSCD